MGYLKSYRGWFGLIVLTYTGFAWAYMLYNPKRLGWTVLLCAAVLAAWVFWFLQRRQEPKPAKSRTAPVRTPAGLLIATVLALACTWCFWDLVGTLRLNQVRSELIEGGYGYLYAPPAQVPDEENGATWFSKAVVEVDRLFALLDAKTPPGRTRPSDFIFELKRKMPDGDLTTGEWEAARRLVGDSGKALSLFERACRQDVWDWGVDWEKFYSGQKVSLPESGTPVSMMDIWLLKCFLKMRAGQTDSARQDARKGLALAEHFSNDPWMGEFLYGTTAKVIYMKHLSPLWMGALGGGEWPDELSADREYARFLKIGRTVLLNSVRDYDAGVLAGMMRPGGKSPDEDPESASAPWVAVAFLYKPFLKIERSWLGSWGKSVLSGMKPSAADLAEKTRDARQSLVPWNSRYSIWAFEYHLENVFYCMAQMRLHKALASCQRFKALTGRWPDKVQDLVNVTASDNDLMDPFAPGFLRLANNDGWLVLYSVGRNFVDDGGEQMRENGSAGDIVLTVGLAKKKR